MELQSKRKFLTLNTNKLLLSVVFLALAVISGGQLVNTEKDLVASQQIVNGTPVKLLEPKESNGALVFIAHGFAGSSNFMRPLAVSLSHSGFTTIRYDFLGHGENKNPYSGSITQLSGATEKFVNQTNSIVNHYKEVYEPEKMVLIGHSMASDIIMRTALKRDDIFSVIGISAYTDAITAKKPSNILILNGEWEPRLKLKAYDILTKIGIARPEEDITYGSFNDGSARKISTVINADHVGILFSERTQIAIGAWLNEIFKSEIISKTNKMGIWIAILLLSIFILIIFFILSFPKLASQGFNVSFKKFIILSLLSSFITPLILSYGKIPFINYSAQNHLINHLFLYTCICWICVPLHSLGKFASNRYLQLFSILVIVYTFIIGVALNSYVSTFIPLNFERLSLLAILLIGCIPYMMFVQVLRHSQSYGWLMATISNTFLIISLALSVYLNFEELFLIGYSILLFILFSGVFGLLSTMVAKRVNSHLAIANANGVLLACAFATAIPLYIP